MSDLRKKILKRHEELHDRLKREHAYLWKEKPVIKPTKEQWMQTANFDCDKLTAMSDCLKTDEYVYEGSEWTGAKEGSKPDTVIEADRVESLQEQIWELERKIGKLRFELGFALAERNANGYRRGK